MSKSLGNLVFVSDLLKIADPRAIRLALMRHHYRSRLRVVRHRSRRGDRAAAPAARRGRSARPVPIRAPFAQRVRDAIDDDLDAPRALDALDDLASAILSGGDDADRARGAVRARRAARRRPRTARSRVADALDHGDSAASTDTSVASARYRRAVADAYEMTHERADHGHACPTVRAGSVDAGTTPADGRGVDRPAAREGRGRRQGRRRVDRPRSPARPRRRRSRSSRPTSDDGREVLRHSTAHVMAEAVTRLFPGAKYAIGPAIADGFYYDFELPDGQTFSDDDLGADRSRDARDREGTTSASCATSSTYDDALAAVRRPAVQAGDHREGARRRRRRAKTRARPAATAASRCTATSSTATVDVRRPVPRPARAVDRQARRVQAHEGRGRVLARQREGPDAPAHLRHRVGVEGRARRAPAPPRGSRARATTASSASSSTCSRSPRRSARASRCSTRRARSCAASWRSTRAQRHEAAGYEFVNSPHITQGRPLRDVGPPRLVRRRHVPADAPRRGRPGRRGHDLLPQADELPVPRPDLPAPHALVPRAAAAVLRVRHGVPLREVGRRARPHARARHDPGRRAHLLHEGADGRASSRRCSTSCSTCCATTASTTSTSSCRPSREGKAVGTDEEWDEATEALRVGRARARTSSS